MPQKLHCNSSSYGWLLMSGTFIQFKDLSELIRHTVRHFRLIPLKLSQSPQPTHSNLLTLSYPRWRHRTTTCDNHHYWFNIAHRSLPPFNVLTCRAFALHLSEISHISWLYYTTPFIKCQYFFWTFFKKNILFINSKITFILFGNSLCKLLTNKEHNVKIILEI